jgi:hypothetical protein
LKIARNIGLAALGLFALLLAGEVYGNLNPYRPDPAAMTEACAAEYDTLEAAQACEIRLNLEALADIDAAQLERARRAAR